MSTTFQKWLSLMRIGLCTWVLDSVKALRELTIHKRSLVGDDTVSSSFFPTMQRYRVRHTNPSLGKQ